jgi:O-antigen/teichoic acid export membrane protein
MKGTPSLGRATVVSAIVDGTLAVVALAVTPLLIRKLGTEPYGVVGLITVLGSQLSTLQLGVGPALLRALGEARGRDDGSAVRATLGAGAALGALSAAVVGALAFVLAPRAWSDAFATSAAVRPQALAAVPATAALLALQPVLAVVFSSLSGLERFSLLNGVRLVHGIARALAGAVTALRGGGLVGVLLAQAAVDALLVATVPLLVRHRLPPAEGRLPLRAAVTHLLRLGLPLSAAGIAASLLLDGDKIALGTLRSVAEVAFYTVPAGVVGRLGSFAGMACIFLVPRLASAAAAGQTEEAARLAGRATRLGLCLTAAAAAPLAAVTPELLSLWLGPAFAARSAPAARVMLVGLAIQVSVYGAHAAIRARAHASTLAVVYALELPVFAAALYLLVRPWGVTGAALAWTVRLAFDAALQHVIARRSLGRPVVPFALPALAAAALAALALGCHALGAALPVLRLAAGLVTAAVALLWLPADDRDALLRALWLTPARGAA